MPRLRSKATDVPAFLPEGLEFKSYSSKPSSGKSSSALFTTLRTPFSMLETEFEILHS